MSLLDMLSKAQTWAEFREYKSKHSHMTSREFDALDEYIEQQRYLGITDRLCEPDHGFSLPVKRVINKSGTRKKRTIYTFTEDETWVLKLLTWLLYKYDFKLSDSCFSFRRNKTVGDALESVLAVPDIEKRYGLKMDIHDYFNSMPVSGMEQVLREVIDDDEQLRDFMIDILSVNRAVSGDEVIEAGRGAMAGVPISAFMANIYLLSLDREFERLGIPYFRYSDDILIFASSEEERKQCKKLVEERIAEKGLEMNPDKLLMTEPGEPWEFLGFEYRDGRIDLSGVTIRKMKAKIRRKCRAIYRWRIKKDVDFDHAATVAIRVFNRKFFDIDEEYDFTWSRWFFPLLTSDEGLRTIDTYLTGELRYIYSGRHYKGNYAITYEHLKELGLRSLVHEYYAFKESGAVDN